MSVSHGAFTMLLLAARILVPKVPNNGSGSKLMILTWNKFTEKKVEEEEQKALALAYYCNWVWKCIPEKMPHTI